MTDEEKLALVQRARKLCERNIESHSRPFPDEVEFPEIKASRLVQLNSWTTHLAEMDEHKERKFGYNASTTHCSRCSRIDFVEYPCPDLLTKAKRLLGVN